MYDRVKGLCKKKGISIARLEKLTGISNGTIRHWKTNPNPQVETLFKVAKFFGVRMEWLMGKTIWKRI